jgi:two-component system response regulator HydG
MNAMVRDGLFRDDFLYRIRVVAIRVPPLRERGQDVLLLARRFVEHFARIQKRTVGGLTPKAIDALLSHRFPGNVRELENAIHRAVVFAEGDQIDYEDLPQEVRERVDEKSTEQSIPRNAVELRLAKEQAASKIEKAFLISLLERASGNVTTAAQLASMNRSVLHQLLTRQGIMPHQFRSRSE